MKFQIIDVSLLRIYVYLTKLLNHFPVSIESVSDENTKHNYVAGWSVLALNVAALKTERTSAHTFEWNSWRITQRAAKVRVSNTLCLLFAKDKFIIDWNLRQWISEKRYFRSSTVHHHTPIQFLLSAAFPKHSDFRRSIPFSHAPVESQSLLMPTCERCLHFPEERNVWKRAVKLKIWDGNPDWVWYRILSWWTGCGSKSLDQIE